MKRLKMKSKNRNKKGVNGMKSKFGLAILLFFCFSLFAVPALADGAKFNGPADKAVGSVGKQMGGILADTAGLQLPIRGGKAQNKKYLDYRQGVIANCQAAYEKDLAAAKNSYNKAVSKAYVQYLASGRKPADKVAYNQKTLIAKQHLTQQLNDATIRIQFMYGLKLGGAPAGARVTWGAAKNAVNVDLQTAGRLITLAHNLVTLNDNKDYSLGVYEDGKITKAAFENDLACGLKMCAAVAWPIAAYQVGGPTLWGRVPGSVEAIYLGTQTVTTGTQLTAEVGTAFAKEVVRRVKAKP
jgi:hypothetical protein